MQFVDCTAPILVNGHRRFYYMACTLENIPEGEVMQEWLIKDLIPKGHLVLLAGESGIGKSSLTAYLATQVDSTIQVAFYLLEDTIQSYVNKIGRPENINYIDFKDDRGVPYIPQPSELRDAIMQYNFQLVVIDPIAIMSNDINDNAKVRALLTPLEAICEELGCTIIGVHHFSKGNGRVKDRATGAHAWVATPRHTLSLVADKDKNVYLEVTKSNIGPTGQSWQVVKEITPFTMRVADLVNAEEGSAQKALDSIYEKVKEDKLPNVVYTLKQEYDLGEPFGIEEIKECGNLQTFYNYYNTHPEQFGCNKSPRNRRAGEKKKYWFK